MNSLGFDDELPAGFQDADLEMRELRDRANRATALRHLGICDHGWTQGPPGPPGKPTSVWTCLQCGTVFTKEPDLQAAQEAVREMTL